MFSCLVISDAKRHRVLCDPDRQRRRSDVEPARSSSAEGWGMLRTPGEAEHPRTCELSCVCGAGNVSAWHTPRSSSPGVVLHSIATWLRRSNLVLNSGPDHIRAGYSSLRLPFSHSLQPCSPHSAQCPFMQSTLSASCADRTICALLLQCSQPERRWCRRARGA